MANGSSRVLAALVTLVVGFGIGWIVHRPEPATGPPVQQIIRVKTDGTVSKPEVSISRENKDVVLWAADSGSLAILFPKDPKGVTQPPFEYMTQQGDDWAVTCDNDGNGVCFSGPVNSKLSLPKGSTLKYKYDQVVGGKRSDGMIIVRP